MKQFRLSCLMNDDPHGSEHEGVAQDLDRNMLVRFPDPQLLALKFRVLLLIHT